MDLPEGDERLTQRLIFQCQEGNRITTSWTCGDGIIKSGAGHDLQNHVINVLPSFIEESAEP